MPNVHYMYCLYKRSLPQNWEICKLPKYNNEKLAMELQLDLFWFLTLFGIIQHFKIVNFNSCRNVEENKQALFITIWNFDDELQYVSIVTNQFPNKQYKSIPFNFNCKKMCFTCRFYLICNIIQNLNFGIPKLISIFKTWISVIPKLISIFKHEFR